MMIRAHRRSAALAAVLLIATASRGAARAQALERNLPPQPQAAPVEILPPQALARDQDIRPIGPALRGIVVLGPADAVRDAAAPGVSVGSKLSLDPARTKARLGRFLNRPLSRRLIAEIQATITLAYRRAGYPFVSVSTPVQELTQGVLQVRVIEFHLGRTTIKGAGPVQEAYLKSRIRVQPGEAIASADLGEDLDALNRYPFRRVDATFTPGAGLGDTDLILNVTRSRPWSAYAGYANSGSPSTGWDRYFAGAQLGGLLGPDSLISNQVTASADALFNKSRPLNGAAHPQYLSDAASLILPMGPRAQIEASFDWVATSAVSDPFEVRQTTYEGRIGYRFALSNLDGDVRGWGDARFGVEAKRQQAVTFFDGARATDLAVEVYQAYLGYSNAETDALGRSDLDLVVHLSPGGLGGGDTRAQALLFSNGRVGDVRYAYLGLTIDRATRLPLGLMLTTQLIGQYSPRALQGSEQMGVGGASLVRGYVLDDGAYDEAVVLRSELRGSSWVPGPANWAGQVSPYLFADAGSGRDENSGHTVSASSLGLGADMGLARRVLLSVDGACALNRAIQTRAGDWRLETRASLAF